MESVCAGNRTAGSNPALSAILFIDAPIYTCIMDGQNQTGQATPQSMPQPAPAPTADEAKPLSRADRLKRSFLQVLIGCLIGAAAIAVVAVLMGSFNDTLVRALGTIGVVALHALLSFSYISESEKRDKKDGGRSIELFSNTVFCLIAISFITSVFAIWQLLGGEITLKLYMFYVVVLFATLHADVLYRIRGFEKRIDNSVTANYLFMSAVVLMLTVVIFSASPSGLGHFFYRLLAAIAIVDATMTITAIIMHKLYLQKHPELAASTGAAPSGQSKNFWKNPLVILLFIFLAVQVVGTVVALIMHG